MTRRELLRIASLGAVGTIIPKGLARRWIQDGYQRFEGAEVLQRILSKSSSENWYKLPIGELMGKVALEFKGTPYIGFTLEISKDIEYCVVNLHGLDCVTFFENTLAIARMIKKGYSKPEDLIAEVKFTRYRNGQMGDFRSRLHYTTDWIVDNEAKGVVKNITADLPGAEPFEQKVGIMSKHPENYRQLVANPNYITDIRLTEDTINARTLKYLPMEKLEAAEKLLKTGDIVGVCTKQEGIDIAHTGICWKDDDGVMHFMDASSARPVMKVNIEGQISKCLNWSPNLTGVMIARPLELR